jgi:hypothetical protein
MQGMTRLSDKSLKALNMKWLVGLAFLDAMIAIFLFAPAILTNATVTQLGVTRGLFAFVLPVLVLLLVNVLPHDVKSMLVYWKPRGVLPGCEAFTKYAPADNRIDMNSLRKHVGPLPTDPVEQNSKWYRLYKMVADEPEVTEAHKLFLMYRDMAVLSLPLIVIMPVAIYAMGTNTRQTWTAASLFTGQYILTALSARWSGIRFVCNVLAVHSTKKVVARKASAV